jgi:hypothetical protein
LPEILTQEQVIHALNSCTNIKHKLLLGLFYGTGMRMSELKNLKMKDIDRENSQIKVIAGKGSRDRFTLLPKQLLSEMEQYYRQYRPEIYFFEGQIPGKPMNERSIQHALRQCMKLAGLEQYKFSAHSLRHSFATHLLDQGNDIHTIKELLGHSKIETTMIYLHLQKKKRAALCSPFDFIMTNNDWFQALFKDPCIQQFNSYSQSVFKQLSVFQTAQKGVHRLRCSDEKCEKELLQYHACGNRHCPHCGGFKREEWIENRMQELLPTAYYHLVFTLPHELNPLILGNRKELFKLLFDSVSQTILQHAKMPEYIGAECGITMILHTWGQELTFHPHVHCIVTAGGYDGEKWIEAKRKKDNFLFSENSLKKMYKAKFLDGIAKLELKKEGLDYPKIIREIGFKKWNVYAKAPFGGPA